jgi:hypothetical protein
MSIFNIQTFKKRQESHKIIINLMLIMYDKKIKNLIKFKSF